MSVTANSSLVGILYCVPNSTLRRFNFSLYGNKTSDSVAAKAENEPLTNKVKANKIAKAYFNRFFITFPSTLFPPARLES